MGCYKAIKNAANSKQKWSLVHTTFSIQTSGTAAILFAETALFSSFRQKKTHTVSILYIEQAYFLTFSKN